MKRRQVWNVLAVLSALSLIFAGASAGYLGPDAERLADDLNPTDDAKAVAGTTVAIAVGGAIVGGAAVKVYEDNFGSNTVDEQEDIAEVDAYTLAVSQKDNLRNFNTSTGNFVTDARTVAFNKGQIAAAKAIANGSDRATVQAKAREAVEDYYSSQMEIILRESSVAANSLYYVKNGSTLSWSVDGPEIGNARTPDSFSGRKTKEVTLPNGDTYNVTLPEFKHSYTTTEYAAVGPGGRYLNGELYASDPNGGTTKVYDGRWLGNIYQDLKSQEQQLDDDIQTYAGSVYDNYTAGQITVADIYEADPGLVAQEAALNYNQTGSNQMAAIELAALGYRIPTNNSAMTIYYNESGYRQSGVMAYSGDDQPNWTVGTKYVDYDTISDPANWTAPAGVDTYNGTVLFNWQKNGRTGTISVSENFTITEARNPETGNTTDVVQTHQYVRSYEDANTSQLQQELDDLIELRQMYKEELEEQADGGGSGPLFGGGGLPSPGEMPTWAIWGGALLLIGGVIRFFTG